MGNSFWCDPLQSFVVRSKCGEEKPGPGERSSWPVLHAFLRPLERGVNIVYIFKTLSVTLNLRPDTRTWWPGGRKMWRSGDIARLWSHQLLWGQEHNGDCAYLERSKRAGLLSVDIHKRDRKIPLNIPTIDKFQVFFCRKPCQCVKNENKLKC